MKIYTRTGDKGETSLLGGKRISKDNIQIEAYGTVDELNSYVGLLRDQDIPDSCKQLLLEIQDRLFRIGSVLAAGPNVKLELPRLEATDTLVLEKEIDRMTGEIPEMKSFILPGGHQVVSYCHITRCVCRRAERNIIHFSHQATVDELVIKYLNRLSDYLFVLARWLSFYFSAPEIPWKARL